MIEGRIIGHNGVRTVRRNEECEKKSERSNTSRSATVVN